MKARLTCHSLLALSIAALLPAGSALAATTSGGTVNFSGKVVTSACAISAGSANIDVDMGKCVPPRWLPQAVKPVPQKPSPSRWRIAKSPIPPRPRKITPSPQRPWLSPSPVRRTVPMSIARRGSKRRRGLGAACRYPSL